MWPIYLPFPWVQDVAKATGSSAAACIRFASRLGFAGYTELRMALAKEVFSSERVAEEQKVREVTEKTSAGELVHLVVGSTCESLRGLESVIDPKAVEASVEAILHASHLLISGVGASGVVGIDLQQKLARLGLKAVFTADSDMQIVEACARANRTYSLPSPTQGRPAVCSRLRGKLRRTRPL